MKKAVLFVVGLISCSLISSYGYAAPVIGSIGGAVGNGQTVTIAGSGFGAKSPAKPYLWAPFDGGSINPSPLGMVTSWSYVGNMAYNSTEGINGKGCAKSADNSGSWTMETDSNGFAWNDYNSRVYVFRKVKRNFDVNFNWKIWRMWNSGYTFPDVFIQGQNHDVTVEGGTSYSYLWGDLLGPTNAWNTEEVLLKNNSSSSLKDAYIEFKMNGVSSGSVPSAQFPQYYIQTNNGSPMTMHFPVHAVEANTTMPSGSAYWADDVYVDTTWARVMIGDASTWANCMHREIQIPQTWSSDGTQISAVVNQGTFAANSTAYLYVIDAAGNISAGMPITFGSSTASDTSAPTVSISSPTTGATVTATTSVTASAADNVGVTKVDFYVNGVLQGSDTSSPYVFSWNTSSLAAGTYTLAAKAYDAAGNVGQTTNVSVSVVKDTTAPTVSITSPANGATLSGTVGINAGATDNIGVAKVEFYDNGTLLSATNVAPYSYSWSTASAANGSHTLTAKAYDAAGNVATSSSVAVTVNNSTTSDTTPPSVSLTAPGNGATVSGTVAVTASASDNVGVTKVDFYLNGALKATATASPYSYSFNTTSVANGTYTLTAKAYDAAGNVGQSGNGSVTVSNSTQTSPTVTGFSLPSTSTTFRVAITTFTATDNVGVTGYLVKESSAAPSATSSGWSATPPTSYTFSSTGTKTLYAWAKDAAGVVSGSKSAQVTISASNTIWPSTTLPATVDAGPDNGVELGVKFRSDVAGYITGIRFYKAGTNTGTHVGNLWSSTGTLMATATFTNETASGWQQVNFSKPVAVTASTVYIASYYAPAAHFSADRSYFTGKGMDRTPLHALASGVSGYNGVFVYGSSSAFPNQSYMNSNYWVDVVFHQ